MAGNVKTPTSQTVASRWAVAGEAGRRARPLGFVVSLMVLGWLPHALVSALGPLSPFDGLFNLPMALIPAVLALAVGARRKLDQGS